MTGRRNDVPEPLRSVQGRRLEQPFQYLPDPRALRHAAGSGAGNAAVSQRRCGGGSVRHRHNSFGPEEASTWELGFELDLADNTLRLNGAVFTTDYDELQFTYRSGVAPYLADAGKASIDGYELEQYFLYFNWDFGS